MNVIKSLWVWISSITFILLAFPVALILWLLALAFDSRRLMNNRWMVIQGIVLTKMSPFWKVIVDGREKLDQKQAYVIIPNHASSSVFLDKRVLPYVGGVVLHGGMMPRGDEQTSLDHSLAADALDGKLHLYPGGEPPDYGIVHRMEVDYNLLIHRLSQHDWGYCGTANPDHVWGQALPTKVGEYFAAGIPVIALNCPPVKPLCDAGMGIYLTDVRDLPKAAATPTKTFKKAVMHNRARFTTERAIEPLVELYRSIV